MLFRPHRGGLSEAMSGVEELESKAELVAKIAKELDRDGIVVTDETVHIKPYGFDERSKWNTHIVTVDGYGVFGFTDGR